MGGLGGGIGSAGVIGQGIVGAGGIGLGVSGAKGALDEASSIGFTPCNLAELALSGAAIGGGAIGVKSTYRWGHNHLFPQPRPINSDWAWYSGHLRAAASGKGNFGIGSGTRTQADILGRAWVGTDYSVSGSGKAWVSASNG